MIDLHTHSTASDGSLSPGDLMRAARDAGLSAIALSDHDTVAGLDEAGAAAKALGLELVPAVELSLSTGGGSLHLLGYLMDHHDPRFRAGLAAFARRREERNRRMGEALAALGIPVSPAELLEAAGGPERAGVIGRPHFARVLVARGVVANLDEAFARYLGKGRPAYVPKARIEPEEGISLIRQAGGLAVLAHPRTCGVETAQELENLVLRLKAAGLAGIECLHSDHSPDDSARFLTLARRHGLLVTGGTDFHGTARPGVALGRLPGGRRIADSFLHDLKARHRSG